MEIEDEREKKRRGMRIGHLISIYPFLKLEDSAQCLISSNFNQDNTLNIRVHSDEQPDETFVKAKPILEDVYFVSLKGDK